MAAREGIKLTGDPCFRVDLDYTLLGKCENPIRRDFFS